MFGSFETDLGDLRKPPAATRETGLGGSAEDLESPLQAICAGKRQEADPGSPALLVLSSLDVRMKDMFYLPFITVGVLVCNSKPSL